MTIEPISFKDHLETDSIKEADSIRAAYQKYGSENFYKQFGSSYKNPHEPKIREVLKNAIAQWKLDLSKVLDLAAGGGEVTAALQDLGYHNIQGMDPHTHALYAQRTSKPVTQDSFQDLATAKSDILNQKFSIVICSFAMHLLEPSWLPALLSQLGRMSDTLLIISPHKKPVIKPEWGWKQTGELIKDRVHARLYQH